MNLFGSPSVKKLELYEYIEQRLGELHDQIEKEPTGNYESQLKVLQWKAREEELFDLYHRFGLEESEKK